MPVLPLNVSLSEMGDPSRGRRAAETVNKIILALEQELIHITKSNTASLRARYNVVRHIGTQGAIVETIMA